MRRLVTLRLVVLALALCREDFGMANQTDSHSIRLAEPFKYTRLFADSTGRSHFADEEMEFTLVDFAPPAPAISLSEAIEAKTMLLMSSPSGWHGDWHPAPQRQFIIILTGVLEVEVSDGEVRRFGPGSVALVEDTFGKGHISRVVSKERGYCVVVPLTEAR